MRLRKVADEAFAVVYNDRSPAALLHGDLHPANVFLSGDGATFIDPYGLAGDPAYDVSFIAAYDATSPWAALENIRRNYDRDLGAAEYWLRWILIYRLDNALRNGLEIARHFQNMSQKL